MADAVPEVWARGDYRSGSGEIFSQVDPAVVKSRPYVKPHEHGRQRTLATINPLLEMEMPPRHLLPGPHFGTTKYVVPTTFFYSATTCKLLRELPGVSREASWRRMYLCDPPCTMVNTRMTFESTRVLRKWIVKAHCVTASLWDCYSDLDGNCDPAQLGMQQEPKGNPVNPLSYEKDVFESKKLDVAASGWTFGALVDRMVDCGSTCWVKHPMDGDEHIDLDIRKKIQKMERTDGCTVGIKQKDFNLELCRIAVPTELERRIMAEKGSITSTLPESESRTSARRTGTSRRRKCSQVLRCHPC